MEKFIWHVEIFFGSVDNLDAVRWHVCKGRVWEVRLIQPTRGQFHSQCNLLVLCGGLNVESQLKPLMAGEIRRRCLQ